MFKECTAQKKKCNHVFKYVYTWVYGAVSLTEDKSLTDHLNYELNHVILHSLVSFRNYTTI